MSVGVRTWSVFVALKCCQFRGKNPNKTRCQRWVAGLPTQRAEPPQWNPSRSFARGHAHARYASCRRWFPPARVLQSRTPRPDSLASASRATASILTLSVMRFLQYYFTVTFNHDNQKALELRTEDVKDCDEWVAAITQARYTLTRNLSLQRREDVKC